MTIESTGIVVAAFDLGSNSIKMSVMNVMSNGEIEEQFSAMRTTRLGDHIDQTGRIADNRIEDTMAALHDFCARAIHSGATNMIAVATEAVRVAENGPAFLLRVEQETGIKTVTISGDVEASLAYAGIMHEHTFEGFVVMADIGGASSELVFGNGPNVRWSHSFPIGSGRLTDALINSDPPTVDELYQCSSRAIETFREAPFTEFPGATLALAGGTGEYLGRLLGAGESITSSQIDDAIDLVSTLNADELASRIDILPIRARVLPAGIAIGLGITRMLNPTTIMPVRGGLRTGLVLAAAKGTWK